MSSKGLWIVLWFLVSNLCYGEEVMDRLKARQKTTPPMDSGLVGPELSLDNTKTWSDFESYVGRLERRQQVSGMAYIVTGVVVALGATIAFDQSDDTSKQVAFALTESLGIGAIGYGVHGYYTGSYHRSFFHIIDSSSLSPTQKNELLNSYRSENKRMVENLKWVKLVTYGLISAVNIYHGTQVDEQGDQNLYYAVGGLTAVAAFSVAF